MCTSLLLCLNEIRCEDMKVKKNKRRRKSDVKSQIILRKNDEIESLKDRVSKLQIDCDEKDEIIGSIDSLRIEMQATLEDLKRKGEEYDRLNADLMQMRKVFSREVFGGELRWKIIRWLIR